MSATTDRRSTPTEAATDPMSISTTTVATPALGLADRMRLSLKRQMWPGTNWVSRDKAAITASFLRGTPESPVETLDCGCGNAFFAYEAVRRHARCLGITIHDWERQSCETMRDYLGVPESAMAFRTSRLDALARDPSLAGRFDQVLLFDVIEHIRDARTALEQLHQLMADDGLIYITTPNRDWQGNYPACGLRVTRVEDGWHVRNGFTFEQLEAVVESAGFEPVDRLRFGTLGSTVVQAIQHRLFGRWIDPLTVATYPILKLIALVLAPWKDPHTVGILARKRSAAERGNTVPNRNPA
jgi:SAM-dependent methyltransferase